MFSEDQNVKTLFPVIAEVACACARAVAADDGLAVVAADSDTKT